MRALIYVGLLSVLFALVAYVAFSQFVRRGVTSTPSIVGLDRGEAYALLADQGLDLRWADEEARYDEDVAVDHVMDQRPKDGTLVKRGATVVAIASRGPQRIEVPSVQGDALQAAQVTLAASGLTVGRTVSVFSDLARDGLVVGQEPPAGTAVAPGEPVDLFLSLASTGDTYLMPDVVTRDYEQVRRFFLGRRFRLGRVSYVRYEGIEPGTILRQYPVAGHPLRSGDVISLAVAAAPPGEADAVGTRPTEEDSP